jgi:DNA processing protein
MTPNQPVWSGLRRTDLRGRPARRRELCVWLGTLASWRRGLIKLLVQEFGSIDKVLGQPPATLRSLIGARYSSPPHSAAVEPTSPGDPVRRQEMLIGERREDDTAFAATLALEPAQCVDQQKRGDHAAVVAWCDPLYPPALRQLGDAPLRLFVRAACEEEEIAERLRCLCGTPAVAVVGTRQPSRYGGEMATLLGRDLTTQGLLVISGLAMGIDAAAHAAALSASCGAPVATVGVLGCGADVVYPKVNQRLFCDVERRGMLLSEFAWGLPARAWRFPARNRVMAALSRAVVIVEGAERSGARLTADFALEMGREVLAVPGEAGRRLSSAPHKYLRQGASLCESARDVVSAIATVRLPPSEELSGDLSAQLVRELLETGSDSGRLASVLQALEGGEMTADEISRLCELRVHVAAALLSELEIDGLAQLGDGGAYRLRRT